MTAGVRLSSPRFRRRALRVGVLLAVAAGAALVSVSLRSVGGGAKRRWLVDSWSPRGGGGARPSRSEGSPFRVRAPAPRASTSLGAAWLLVPAVLVLLALLVPPALAVVERLRLRRARKAFDASRQNSSSSPS